MSVTRYSREVDLDDLNNVHTFAVRAVPPGSRVLDLGAGDGSVALVLAAKGCQVTAVERDPEGVSAIKARGVHAIEADLDTLDASALPRGGFDVVLLLDVLEHLVAPEAVLARARDWLAPGGRFLMSIPHVAHAAVRASLLLGQFPRTETGLLDRTHLHFFDLPQVQGLLASAGLRALDVLTVERGIDETELAVAWDDLPSQVMDTITADPLSRVYQFFIVAMPGADGESAGGLIEAMQGRLRAVEGAYRKLEDYAARIEADGLARDAESRTARQRLDEHVSQLEARVRELGGTCDRVRAEYAEAHDRAVVAEKALEASRAEHSLLARQVTSLEGQLRDLAAERDGLDAERAEALGRTEAAERASEALAARARDLGVLSDRLHAERDEAVARQAAAAMALEAADAERRRLGDDVARLDAKVRDLVTVTDRLRAERDETAAREAVSAQAVSAARAELAAQASHLADVGADRDMLARHLTERMEELAQCGEVNAALVREVAVQREFAASLAAQVPRIAARGGEAEVLATLEQFQSVAPTPADAAALAAEATEFRRLQGAIAVRALARLDAVSRRVPRVRSALRAIARRVAG